LISKETVLEQRRNPIMQNLQTRQQTEDRLVTQSTLGRLGFSDLDASSLPGSRPNQETYE
jgi:hypothetical protein